MPQNEIKTDATWVAVPSIPNGIDPSALKNGFILDAKQSAAAKHQLMEGKNVIQTLAGTDFEIAKVGDQFYVLHSELGRGGSGVVSLAQNIDTGEYVAIKRSVELSADPDARMDDSVEQITRDGYKKEHELLGKVNKTRGDLAIHIIDRSTPKQEDFREQLVLVMELAQGRNLQEFIEAEQKTVAPRSSFEYLQIGTKAVQRLKECHESGLVHRDVKPENFMISPSEEIELIDYGGAISKDKKGIALEKATASMGSGGFKAPELESMKDKGVFTYDEKTDVYSMGVALAQLYGLKSFVNKENKEVINKTPLAEDRWIKRLIAAMTHPDPKKRPTLAQVEKTLNFMKDLQLPFVQKKVGILDIAEYENADVEQKRQMKIALQTIDEIQLIDSRAEAKRDKYPEIVRDLRQAGLMVREQVAPVSNSEEIAAIPKKIAALEKDRPTAIQRNYVCFNVGEKKPDPVLSSKGMLQISVTDDDKAKYQQKITDHLAHKKVSGEDHAMLIDKLKKEAQRSREKYNLDPAKEKPKLSKSRNRAQVRTELIEKTISELERGKGNFTYGMVDKILKDLESNMMPTSFFYRMMGLESISEKNVAVIRQDMQEAAVHSHLETGQEAIEEEKISRRLS